MGEISQGLTFPSQKDIVMLNREHIRRTGGNSAGAGKFHNENSLLWVLDAIRYSDYYPTVSQKAAILAWAIINGHVFIDGNKRTGMMAMMIFLRQNGFALQALHEEIVDVAVRVANAHEERYDREKFERWVSAHLTLLVPPT